MPVGRQVRLNRIFAHPSGRLCSVAVDHFFAYPGAMPPGLADLPATIRAVVAGRPDAITMQKGAALACWGEHAGKLPLILQSYLGRAVETVDELIATPEDALRLGADAYATVAYVRGRTEVPHLARVARLARQCHAWEMPLVLHIYPRAFAADGTPSIVHDAEDVAWAVRCAMEVGVDLIKVPYSGDVASYRQIVSTCPVPIVAAGGPKAQSLDAALKMAREVVAAGARGLTVGRNVWGFADVTAAVRAFVEAVHG